MNQLRVLASERRQRFFGHIRASYVLSVHDLVRVVRSTSYSTLIRTAALRNLVAVAPLEVTRGQCFLVRRRLVRAHYQV